jgi:ATP-dependent Clp protease ATP-binding subunit ClpA
VFGARPLRRTIEREVANPLSRRILAGEFAEGDTALVGHADGPDGRAGYTFEKKKARARAEAKA